MKLKEIPSSILRSAALNIGAPSQTNKAQVDCVVSLTSIPPRLPTLHLTIRSLLRQDIPPKNIILWLNHSLEDQIPQKLSKLEGQVFKIKFRDHSSSHRKLVYALAEFPNETIVTCDDDVMYPSNWLNSLYNDHLEHPELVIAHQCRTISYDQNGELLPYKLWTPVDAFGFASHTILPIGCGGVLYPKGCLHSEVTNRKLYMDLAPRADDLWFKAMGLLAGTKTFQSSKPTSAPVPIMGAKGNSLANTNIKEDGNRVQWKAICEYFAIPPAKD